MPHHVDNLKLADESVHEDLDGLDSEELLQFLNVGGLVHDLHQVLGPFLVVDAVDAGLGETLCELFHDVIAGFHYFGTREGLDLKEGVPWLSRTVPELSLIF